MLQEDYFFSTEEDAEKNNGYLVVVCYDISDNKRRLQVVKLLEKYVYRVQKSVFEGFLNKKKYEKLRYELKQFTKIDENIRLYKINGSGDVSIFGNAVITEDEDIIII